MKFVLTSCLLTAVLSTVLGVDDCSLNIGDRDYNDVRHRRMVSVNLSKDCNKSSSISIDIPHDGVKRTFDKVMTNPSATQGRNKNTGTSDCDFAYWYGEDASDGSTFNYVQDCMGNVAGSLVDITNHNVIQFHIENGVPTAIITDSNAFGDELDPPELQEPLQHERRLDSPNVSSSVSSDPSASQKVNSILPSLSAGNGSRDRVLDDSGAILDIMVVWDREAECRNNGQPVGCTLNEDTRLAMEGRVALAIAETNLAYSLSGVNTELRLVHQYLHPTYVAPGFSQALNEITSTTDGNADDIHDKRTEYGADIVALIIDDPQYCGIAWLGPSKSYMFSVTAWNCATGYYSFGHEIGHNLGLNHDRGTTNTCGQQNTYNYGYRAPNANFRSILAYNCVSGQCDQNAGGGCTRVQRFSNTDFNYNGAPIGSATENNARAINDVRATVAAYYTHVPPTNPPVTTPTDPPVEAPSKRPSASPTASPSSSPSASPTVSPSSSPSDPPVVTPTDPPVVTPTDPPVVTPTDPPVVTPTDPPVVTPTDPPATSSPTVSPSSSPSDAPVVTPTDPPVLEPTIAPTTCVDTKGKFWIGNQRRNWCRWARQKPNKRCKPKVKPYCPVTCSLCTPTCQDGTERFWANNKWRYCPWAKKGNSVARCLKPGVAEICKLTCGMCDE